MVEIPVKLPTTVDYNGRAYRLRTAYDCVLEAMKIERMEVPRYVKTTGQLSWLIKGRYPIDEGLLNAAYNTFVPPPKIHIRGPVYMDLVADMEYIYPSFLQAYGIDLIKERGRMHFCAFYALLKSLPHDTKLAEVIDIRRRPLPRDAKAASELVDLKAFYKLDVDNSQEIINQLGRQLESVVRQNGR